MIHIIDVFVAKKRQFFIKEFGAKKHPTFPPSNVNNSANKLPILTNKTILESRDPRLSNGISFIAQM